MDLMRVIVGPVVTEKAERLKATPGKHVLTVHVAPTATKIDVKRAVEFLYDVKVDSVRVIKIQPKTRVLSAHSTMEKRHAGKKALVTLSADSKPIDLANVKAS